MFKIKTALRLAFFVTLIVGGNLWLAMKIGVTPQPTELKFSARVRQAQTIAAAVAAVAENGNLARLKAMLQQLLEQDGDLASAGIRYPHGGHRLALGEHSRQWTGNSSSPDELSVAIKANRTLWGHLELRYVPVVRSGLWTQLANYPANFLLFLCCSTCLMAWLLFARIFRYLDPTRVVPGRVRSALDTLAEGLVLLDPSETIVHANEAFGEMLNVEPDTLIGQRLELWAWQNSETDELPWTSALKQKKELTGILLFLSVAGETRKYLVNANPILGDKGATCRGVLISFDDVTQLERKKQDLAETISSLRNSRDEIRKQNRKLRFLASRDPLTSCYNRRSFWEAFDEYWKTTPRDLLNVIMVDIDHFKGINDNHGHSTGDSVLRETGAMLIHLVGRRGMVCRFGGEEFAVLLPRMSFQLATDVANTLHTAFQHCKVGGLEVTASLGLSNCRFNAMDAQHLLDQADQCLYAAKRTGRNRVVSFDQVQKLSADSNQNQLATDLHEKIPYTTVTALFSVFARTIPDEVLVRKRVAELCVHVGRPFLYRQQVYWTESAAMLQSFYRCLSDCACGEQVQAARSSHPVNRPEFLDSSGSFGWQQSIADAGQSAQRLRETVGPCEIASILEILGRDGLHLFESSISNHSLDAAALILAICNLRVAARQPGGSEALSRWEEFVDRVLAGKAVSPLAKQIIDRILAVETELDMPKERGIGDPGVVSTLERYHDPLNLAIAGLNKSRLGEVTASILRDFPQLVDKQLTRLVDQLDKAARQRDPAFDELAEMADQILDICRSSRTFLNPQNSLSSTSGPVPACAAIMPPSAEPPHNSREMGTKNV